MRRELKIIRNWLRKIRKQSGYESCEKLANVLGISGSHYTNIENGNRTPKPFTAQKIAIALNFNKYGYDWTNFYSTSDSQKDNEECKAYRTASAK